MSFETLRPYLPWLTLVLLVLIVGAANPAFFDPVALVGLMADIVPLFNTNESQCVMLRALQLIPPAAAATGVIPERVVCSSSSTNT